MTDTPNQTRLTAGNSGNWFSMAQSPWLPSLFASPAGTPQRTAPTVTYVSEFDGFSRSVSGARLICCVRCGVTLSGSEITHKCNLCQQTVCDRCSARRILDVCPRPTIICNSCFDDILVADDDKYNLPSSCSLFDESAEVSALHERVAELEATIKVSMMNQHDIIL